MPEAGQKGDIDRVGLSDASRTLFDEIIADNYFRDGVDAYRLAAALAISQDVDISDHVVKRQNHIYLLSQVDPDQVFGEVIAARFPKYARQKYRSLEKFADLGMSILKKQIDEQDGLAFWLTE